jgi:transcriptional regulator with XRE-family HTH domain
MILKRRTDEEDKLKRLGNNLSNVLESKNMTVKDLVLKVNDISANTIYSITWGKSNPSYLVLARICEALEIEAYELFK